MSSFWEDLNDHGELGFLIRSNVERYRFKTALKELNFWEDLYPEKAKAIADMRKRVKAEQQANTKRKAEVRRRYRARLRKERLEADDRTCMKCSAPLKGMRSDAEFCSAKCRVYFWRI